MGDGIDSAAENGYIAEPEMDNIVTETEAVVLENEIETVELDINTGVKINNFLMDDYNLSAEIGLNFDEEIKKHVDFDNIKNIEFSDLIVLDEEKRIIFAAPFMTNDRFDELCNKYELSYKRGEFNENYMNNGLNSFGKYINKESNTIQWIYNMYAEGYPKSKELNFYFTEITIYNEGYYPLEDKLKVDGGASANNLMLDFQANILGVELERPTCIETTALGAAYLCGLALGVYSSIDEIRSINKPEKTVIPSESEEWRASHIKKWRKAVERSLAWEE